MLRRSLESAVFVERCREAVIELTPAVPPAGRIESEDSSQISTLRRRSRLVAGCVLLGLSLLAVTAASLVWTVPALELVDCEASQSPFEGPVVIAMALSAVGLVALLGIRWLLGPDAETLLTAHRWFLSGVAVLCFPLLVLIVAIGADRPSCGHHSVVSLALGLTVYWPTVTVMVSGYRGVRSPDAQRARRVATACSVFLALWCVALLVLQLE